MDSDGLLECSLCLSPSDDLRLLSCTHSYCASCLEGWAAQRQNMKGKRIICPDCRQVTVLPPGGVADLNRGISMRVAKQLIQTQQASNQQSSNQQPSSGASGGASPAKSCQFCHSNYIHAWCVQCHRNLCKSCAETHCQRAAFRTHKLESAIIGVICDAHGENGEYYCYQCSKPMCVICVQQEHQHDVVSVQQAYDDYRQKMEAASLDLKPLVVDLKAMQDALLSVEYPQLIARQHKEAKDKIKDITQKAIDDIKEWEQDTLEALFYSTEAKQKTYEAKMESLNTAYATGSTLMDQIEKSECSTILKEGLTAHQKVNDIKELYGDVVNYVPETVAFEPTGKKQDLDFGDLQEGEVEFESPVPKVVSRIQPTSSRNYENVTDWIKPKKIPEPKPKPRLKESPAASQDLPCIPAPKANPKPICLEKTVPSQNPPYIVREIDYSTISATSEECDVKGEAMAIAFGPDNTVIVSDLLNGMLFQCSPDGTTNILVQPGTMQPRGLAVGPDGKIYTCDAKAKTIWIFNRNGKTVSQWVKSEMSFPKGIGVLKNDHVVVADRDLCKVFIYDSSGKLQRSFGQKGSHDSHLKTPGFISIDAKDRILVSDYGNKAIKIFAASSAFLMQIPLNWPKLQDVFHYQSICTDTSGNIYIAQKNQDKVVKLSKDGAYLGPCLSAKDSTHLQSPCSMAMDKDGCMAIAEAFRDFRIIKIIKLI